MTDLGVIATSVLIGSATGIGGAVLGAWMNARSQMAGLKLSIAAEDDRARRTERRRVYAKFMTTHSVGQQELFDALTDVMLVAANEVAGCAVDAMKALEDFPRDNGDAYTRAVGVLLEAMRVDLGQPAFDEPTSAAVGAHLAGPRHARVKSGGSESDSAGPEVAPSQ